MKPDIELFSLRDDALLFHSHLEASLSHPHLHFLVYLARTFHSLDLHHPVFFLEVVHNWHARLHKCFEPLLDTLGIVISTAAGLSSVDETLGHDVFGAVEKEGKFRGAHGFFKADGLVHFAREACASISRGYFITSCRLDSVDAPSIRNRPLPFS